MSNIQLDLDLANIVIVCVAIVALVAALRQLRTMQVDSRTQIEIAKLQGLATRASVLLNLDERFGSQSMLDARNEMASLIARVNSMADQKWPALAIRERRKKGVDLFPDELEKMRNATPPDGYGRLMVALSFFETVGYVTNSDYIPLDDVIKLFGPAIESAGLAFEAHLIRLRDDVYQNDDLYKNFLWLIKESEKASSGNK